MPMRARVSICLLVIPLLVCGVLDIDSWPFSNFPMYSRPLRLGSFTQYGLFRVRADGSSQEVRTADLLWPINFQRLQAQARDDQRMQTRMLDYSRRWPLLPGERLELREQRVRLVEEGDRLRTIVMSSQVRLKVGSP